VVDALNCDHALSQFTVAADQIKAADVLLLNKCDLVSETGLERVHVRIRDINPKAFIFKTKRGDLNPALIFDLDGRWENRNPVAKTTDFQKSIHTSHLHDKIHCQTMAIGHPLDRSKFLSAIESLPPTVFRMKGIIEFSDSPQPMLFQYVAGRYELSEFPRPEIIDRFLTVITQGKAGNILGGAWITERE